MWTSNDFAGLDQVTTGHMRTIYLSEERQASLRDNASREPFQLTGLPSRCPVIPGASPVFVAYGNTDVFDLGTGMPSAAMVFQRSGGVRKLAGAVNHPGGSGWATLCTKGAPPAVFPATSYPAAARSARAWARNPG